jgi:hypothetical protein
LIQALVDRAFDDPRSRRKIGRSLFRSDRIGRPVGDWRPPTPADLQRANAQSAVAALAARSFVRAQGVRHLYTSLRELPRLRVGWEPLRPAPAIPPAPLVYIFCGFEAARPITTLIAYLDAWDKQLGWDDQVRAGMLRRLNAFAQVELNLWWFAANGGYVDPSPYAVRYSLASLLWHPSIPGAIFCLRCGDELHYQRRARSRPGTEDATARTARCRACSRGREDAWPDHALEPYRRGTWLLRCDRQGCDQIFVGRRQARYCKHHRLSRLTPSARAKTT